MTETKKKLSRLIEAIVFFLVNGCGEDQQVWKLDKKKNQVQKWIVLMGIHIKKFETCTRIVIHCNYTGNLIAVGRVLLMIIQ